MGITLLTKEIKPKNTFYRNEVQYRDDVPTKKKVGIEQKFISDCRYRVIESSSLVPVLFREVFSHPYISFFHFLVILNFFFSISVLTRFLHDPRANAHKIYINL